MARVDNTQEGGNVNHWKIRAVHGRNYKPIEGMLASLRAGRARMGWSYRADLDLRKIVDVEPTGGMLNSEQQDAEPCRRFLTDIRGQDVLWYLCVPEKRKVTVVRVTGEYDYDRGIKGAFDSGPGYDFRSFRPCEAVASDLDIDSETIGPDVRRWLEVRGRLLRAGPHYAMILNECLVRIT